MTKKSKNETPDDESKRRRREQQEMYDRAAQTRAREKREAEDQRIWAKDQNHNTL